MKQTRFSRAVTAAFTGHRACPPSMRNVIKSRLSAAILDAYEHGIRNFVSGFALGFDLLAAEAVLALKASHPDITLTAAVPFRGQPNKFTFTERLRYERFLSQADEVIVLSERYYRRCFLERDEFMVDNASLVIAYYDGREKGGTYYTVKRASAAGIRIVNVF